MLHTYLPIQNRNLIFWFVDLSSDCRNIIFRCKFHFSKEVNFQNKMLPAGHDEHYGMFVTGFYGFVI